MESRVDYLKLHTGASFAIPFEEMVIFATNLEPEDLIDAAFLRRIPYKIEIGPPSLDQYRRIFESGVRAAQYDPQQRGLRFHRVHGEGRKGAGSGRHSTQLSSWTRWWRRAGSWGRSRSSVTLHRLRDQQSAGQSAQSDAGKRIPPPARAARKLARHREPKAICSETGSRRIAHHRCGWHPQ